jgi:hypothetical protein
VDPDGVLTKQGLGVCAGESFDVMAVSVECLMRDESERTRIGRLAAQHAREHHGLDRALDAWKTLLVRMGDAR